MEVIDQFALKEEFEELGATSPTSMPPSPIKSPSGLGSPKYFADLERSMTISRLREALVFADPDNQRAAINKLLARACAVGTEEMLNLESKQVKLNVEFLKNNLKQGILKKSYPGSSGGGGGSDGRKLAL